jgi:ribonuclease PH
MRSDGRTLDALRPVRLQVDFTENPLASVLCEMGRTRVLCTASEELTVPRFLGGTGRGWVTAEYSLLPASTDRRTQEIQRLIGRSLRGVIDLDRLGERTLWLDCDVIQADGGTRTASITGAWVALAIAVARLRARGALAGDPLLDSVAAVSVGLVDGRVVLDLSYEEDARAEVDMNVVATGRGRFVEVQGTAEHGTFSADQLGELTRIALSGVAELTKQQVEAVARARLDR